MNGRERDWNYQVQAADRLEEEYHMEREALQAAHTVDGLRALYVGAVMLFVLWILWVSAQGVLGFWLKHPTWQAQFAAYVTEIMVLLIGLAGILNVLDERKGRR